MKHANEHQDFSNKQQVPDVMSWDILRY